MSDFAIIAQAAELRDRLGLDEASPIPELMSFASNIEKVTVFFRPFSEMTSGICIKLNDSAVIAINSAMSLARQRFSLAHELYHLYYDTDGQDEANADIFASYFLMPQSALMRRVRYQLDTTGKPKLDTEEVIRLEQHFGFSREALLVRLHEGKLITDHEKELYSINIMKDAARFGANLELYKATKEDARYTTVGYYLKAVSELEDTGTISTGKAEEYLIKAYRDDIVFWFFDKAECNTLYP